MRDSQKMKGLSAMKNRRDTDADKNQVRVSSNVNKYPSFGFFMWPCWGSLYTCIGVSPGTHAYSDSFVLWKRTIPILTWNVMPEKHIHRRKSKRAPFTKMLLWIEVWLNREDYLIPRNLEVSILENQWSNKVYLKAKKEKSSMSSSFFSVVATHP